MGRSKPLQIGQHYFPRQLDAVNHFSNLLGGRRLGDEIEAGQEFAELSALLSRHKDSVAKVGCGVRAFVIMLSAEGTICFGVKRVDGTVEDFSFHRCIKQNW